MSKDKYPSIFSPQMGRLLCLLFFKSFSQRAQIGNILGYSPVLAGEYSDVFRSIASERKYLMDYN